jgi:hypothetical protein
MLVSVRVEVHSAWIDVSNDAWIHADLTDFASAVPSAVTHPIADSGLKYALAAFDQTHQCVPGGRSCTKKVTMKHVMSIAQRITPAC